MNTREIIIDAGLKTFLARGYDGTGLGPLLASVGVPKGSFYHFFASKEEFAGAVLDAYAARYREMRRVIFADSSRTPLARLVAYFDELERETTANQLTCGCLYGVLAQSLPALGDALAAKLRSAFAHWQTELAEILAEAQQCGEIDQTLDLHEAAACLIDLYEGAVLRARTGDAVAAFRGFRKFSIRSLRSPA